MTIELARFYRTRVRYFIPQKLKRVTSTKISIRGTFRNPELPWILRLNQSHLPVGDCFILSLTRNADALRQRSTLTATASYSYDCYPKTTLDRFARSPISNEQRHRIQKYSRSRFYCTMRTLSSLTANTFLLAGVAMGFVPQGTIQRKIPLFSSVPSDTSSMSLTLDELKADLVRACTKDEKPSLTEVQGLVRDLEDKAEMVGEGQASSITGILAGEWYVL